MRHSVPTLVSVDVHPAPSPPSQEVGWWRAAGRAISGLLGLIWAFAPEIVAGFFGAFIGLVIGLALGVGLTSELLQGGGAWGRAGPIALILPVFSFVGPALICSMIGATVPPTIALAVHALVLLGATSPKRVALRPVVLATAIGVFGPALVLGLFSDAHLAGAFVALFFAPFTGTLGLLAGAAFVGDRWALRC
jgi:hypothetical protein